MLELTLSQKQLTAFGILDDPTVVEVGFGGGAGGGKTWLVSTWSIIQCKKYPGIRIGLGRKEISNLRKTTAQTYLGEVHPVLGVKDGHDFRYSSIIDPGIYYTNGSQVLFTDLAPAPSDPNFDRLGSLNLTHVVIEEAGEVVERAAKVFSSRRNRYLNREYRITGKTIYTCNPTENFIREEFYDPYIKLGGGDHQVWEFENDNGEPVYVELPDGRLVRAKRAFIKSLPTDNPFLARNYLETLNSLPPAQRRRLLQGDWDFNDDASKLFKLRLFKTASEAPADAERWAGCDPSRGGDNCVFSAIVGDVVTDQETLDIPAEVEDKGTYVAEHFIEFCQVRGVGYEHAAIDAVGIGASVLDACNRLGFKVQAFNAGSTKGVRQLDRYGQVVERPYAGQEGTPLFDNIRSQGYYDMAEAMHTGALQLLDDLPHADKLRRELAAHHYETRERQVIVEKKDKIKAAIGHSPDFADSLLAVWWCKAYPLVHVPVFRVRSA